MDSSSSLLSLNDLFWNTNSIAASVELEMLEALTIFQKCVYFGAVRPTHEPIEYYIYG